MYEQNILRRLYMKTIAAAIAAISLCIAASIATKIWSGLWLVLMAIAAFGYTLFMIRYDEKKGNIIGIRGECIGPMEEDKFLTKVKKQKTYRFIARSEEDEASSLYIKADAGKFREGEVYYLLFKKSPTNEYNEKNLLTYGIIPPTFDTNSTQSVEADADLSIEEDLDEPEQSNAILYDEIAKHFEEEP